MFSVFLYSVFVTWHPGMIFLKSLRKAKILLFIGLLYDTLYLFKIYNSAHHIFLPVNIFTYSDQNIYSFAITLLRFMQMLYIINAPTEKTLDAALCICQCAVHSICKAVVYWYFPCYQHWWHCHNICILIPHSFLHQFKNLSHLDLFTQI